MLIKKVSYASDGAFAFLLLFSSQLRSFPTHIVNTESQTATLLTIITPNLYHHVQNVAAETHILETCGCYEWNERCLRGLSLCIVVVFNFDANETALK